VVTTSVVVVVARVVVVVVVSPLPAQAAAASPKARSAPNHQVFDFSGVRLIVPPRVARRARPRRVR
jgi:hypothetical protein